MSRGLCVLAALMAASSSSGCTGEVNTDDLIVLADAAVDDALTARDAVANSIGIGGDTGDVWPASGVPMPGASRTVDGDGMVSIANGYWTVAIPVDAGMTLELAATVRDNGPATGNAPNTVSMSLLCYSATQIVTLGTAVSDATGKPQTLSIASDHVVAPGELLLLRFVPLAPTTPPTFAQMFSQIRTITVTRRRQHVRTVPLFSSFGGKYLEQPSVEMVFPNNNIAEFPLPVDQGELVTAVSGRVRCGRAGAVTMRVLTRDVTGSVPAATQVGPAVSCAGAAFVDETLQLAIPPHTAPSGFRQYMLDFTMNNSGPVTLDLALVTSR